MKKKMRGGVFSKNIWEGASNRRNENIMVSGTLKNKNPRGVEVLNVLNSNIL